MAESAVDVAVNRSIPSFLTEEMIDAAMSERLSMLEKRAISTYGRRISNDHNYCIDSVEYNDDNEYDDDDSAESDTPVVSVISSDDNNDNKGTRINLNDKLDDKDARLPAEDQNDSNKDIRAMVVPEKIRDEELDNNNKDSGVTIGSENKRDEELPNDSNQGGEVVSFPEKQQNEDHANITSVTHCITEGTSDKIELESAKEIHVNRLNFPVVNESTNEHGKNNEINLRGILDNDSLKNPKHNSLNEENNSNSVTLTSSNTPVVNSDRSELVQETIDTAVKSVCEVKQGFSVKPVSNLLKNDLIVEDKSVKIFKCIEGQIEMLSGVNRQDVKDLMSKPFVANASVSNFVALPFASSESFPKKDLVKIRDMNISDKFLIGRDNLKTSKESCSKDEYITVIKESIPLKTNDGSIYHKIIQRNFDKNSSFNSEKHNKIDERNSSKESTDLNLELPLSERIPISSPAKDNEISSVSQEHINNRNTVIVNSGTESCSERSDSINEVTNEKVASNYVCSNLASKSNITIKPTSKNLFQRRQILPKINYRYHMKDKFIISDKLPKNVTLTKKSAENLYILPDGSTSTQPLLLVPSDATTTSQNAVTTTSVNLVTTCAKNLVTTSSKNLLITPSSQSGIGYQQSPDSPVTIKYMTNKVVSTSESPDLSKPIGSNFSQNSLSVSLKDKCIIGKTWEKVDRFTLNNETSQQKLEELSINSLKAQLLEREVPLYKPTDCCEFYTCLDCNDRFVLESSLRNHRFRKSVLIKYWCRTCSCSLNMYNRCMFLAHIRSHGQLVKNLDMSSLSIEPLPRSLIKFRSNEENNCDNVESSSGSSSKQSPVNAGPILISVNSSSSKPKRPTATKILKKPIPSNFINLSSHEKILDNNVSSFGKVIPKVISSDIDHSKNADKDKEIVNAQLHDDCEDDDFDDDDDDDDHDVCNLDNCDDNEGGSHGVNEVTEVEDSSQTVSDPISRSINSLEKNDLDLEAKRKIELSEVATNQNVIQSNGISADLNLASCKPTENLKSDKQSNLSIKPKVIKKRQCSECGEPLNAKCSLRKHLQNGNRPGDPSLKCNVCRMILPTNCALKMHLRIHMKLKPFRCPECAIEFHIYDRFLMHLKYTCCHLAKCVRYVCSLCGNMQLSLAALEQHLLTRHVRPIFKCGNCPVAFVTLKAVGKHKIKAHPGQIVQTLCYQQCRMCPEKLIPKKKFLEHLKGHISDRVCIYAYQCPKCKSTFYQRTELIYHRMQCDTREGIIKSVLSTSPVSPTDENNISSVSVDLIDNGEDEEQEVVLPYKKRKIVGDDEIEVVEDEQDPLSLEGFQAEEEPLREPLIELCVVCKKENVVILPGKNKSSQSLCCKKCVRPCDALLTPNSLKHVSENKSKLQAAKLKYYKCKICKSDDPMDLKLTYEHFKTYHKELEGQSINEWLIIENRTQQYKRSSTVTTAETIKEKYNKKKKVILNKLPESVPENERNDANEDVPMFISSEKRKPKRLTKPKQKLIEVKSFESGQVITIEDVKPELNCSKCDFIASSKEELRDHITCHRTDPNALQCLECGECFVVLPSLEKHLIINHRISDVDRYIDTNKQYIDGSSEKRGCTEEGQGKESENDFTCRVCHDIFESKTVLDKHFRSHGMAFLFKNSLL